MKKKFLVLCVAILFLPYIYKAFVRRNVLRFPLGPTFLSPNGSHINIRTIIHEPGN